MFVSRAANLGYLARAKSKLFSVWGWGGSFSTPHTRTQSIFVPTQISLTNLEIIQVAVWRPSEFIKLQIVFDSSITYVISCYVFWLVNETPPFRFVLIKIYESVTKPVVKKINSLKL